MKINRHNLTIVTHCAPENLQGRITKGLEFSPFGTSSTNGHYSVSVSALEVDKNEPLGVISPEAAQDLLNGLKGPEAYLPLSKFTFIDGKRPCIDLIPRKTAKFEIYLNASYLLKLAESASDFATPGEDPIIRIQFSAADEPARLEARNTVTGQTWEALVMPRNPKAEAKRFAAPPVAELPARNPYIAWDKEAQRQSAYEHGAMRGERQASPFPPPPPVDPVLTAALAEEDEFAKAMRLAEAL